MPKPNTTDLAPLAPDGNHRRLTATEFQQLSTIPPEHIWLADIATNPNTRRAYKRDIDDFCHFVGLHQIEELRLVTSAHVVAWRTDIEHRLIPDGTDPEGKPTYRKPSGSMTRRKLAALSSLFDYLCDKQAIASNPVRGLKRPKAENNEGATQALGNAQVIALLNSPDANTARIRTARYFAPSKTTSPRPCICPSPWMPSTRSFGFYADQSGVSRQTHVHPHVGRATAITNALHREADMKHAQRWAGHANISTTRLYDHRDQRAEDSPSFKVGYGELE